MPDVILATDELTKRVSERQSFYKKQTLYGKHALHEKQELDKRHALHEKQVFDKKQAFQGKQVFNKKQVFNGKNIVDHVSLTINRGDIYGLIGAGGSGRTMFFRLVCGLAKPTEGRYSLFGETAGGRLRKRRAGMGIMVGEPAIYRDLTALENLVVQSRYFRHPVSREGMRELLELAGLGNAENKRAGRFSEGMRRQLGVALALVGNPEFVILDEPYLEVDDEKAEQLQRLLLWLNREKGLTILFGSVSEERLPGLATRYGFLHEGRLAREISG